MKIPSREDCDLFGVLSMNSEGNICIIRECAPASCNPVCDSKDQKRAEPFFYSQAALRKSWHLRYLPFFWLDTGGKNVQLLP